LNTDDRVEDGVEDGVLAANKRART
jgi:hypothetical protein